MKKIALFAFRIDAHRAAEAEPPSWALLQDDEMIPTQITGKILCGDPPANSNESLEAGVTVVDVLDMEFATNAFSG